jgi:hypothetical protein
VISFSVLPSEFLRFVISFCVVYSGIATQRRRGLLKGPMRETKSALKCRIVNSAAGAA